MPTARPLWTGMISFGLVSVPVHLSSLKAREADMDFTMLDRRDRRRIRYKRVNDATGEEVPWKDIVKGFEVKPGRFVVLTPEDLKNAAPKASRTIEISDFVQRDEVPPWYYDTPYLLEPASEGAKGYDLLCAALKGSGRIGIASIVLHTRQHLAAVIPDGPHLILNTLRFPAELRRPAKLTLTGARAGRAVSREVEMAKSLIDGMTAPWDPAAYRDQYQAKLRAWIEKRAKGAKAAPADEPDEPQPGPYSIMDLLKKSLEGRKPSSRRPSPRTKVERRARAG